MNVCVICGITFGRVKANGRDIRKTCSSECLSHYRRQFYDAKRVVVMCIICKKKNRYPECGKHARTCSKECHAKDLSQRYMGRKLTPEWIARQNESKRRENIVRYGNFTCKICDKQFETNTSLRAHKASCTIIQQKYNCKFCTKSFLKKSALTLHTNIWCKVNPVSEREKTIVSIADGQKRSTKFIHGGPTSLPERQFLETLDELFCLRHIPQFQINNAGRRYDAYYETYNLIIEFDGDYWHQNPDRYLLCNRLKDVHKNDLAATVRAITAGYDVIRVWESDAKQFLHEIKGVIDVGRETVTDFINRTKATTSCLRYTNSNKS